MDEEREEGGGRLLWGAVWVGGILAVAALGAALFLWVSGTKARREAPPVRRPEPPKVRTAPPRRPRPRAAKPEPAAPTAGQEAKAPAFDGRPLSWGVGENQRLFFEEAAPPGSQVFLVVLSPDREVQGTLFLNLNGPVLPSRFVLKDATWGQAKHFGGDDVLLGVVACPGPPTGSAFQDAVGSEAWWQGKLKPAFQMNY